MHKYATLVIELSFENYGQKVTKVAVVEVKIWGRSEKMLKVDFRDVARERLFHHILLQCIGGWSRSYA